MAPREPSFTLLPAPTAYAEDLPYPHAILLTHVAHRGLQAGAALSLPVGAGLYLYRRRQFSRLAASPPTSTATAAVPNPAAATAALRPSLTRALVRAAGIGAPLGAALSVLGMYPHMGGRDAVEWQDRAWRLRANLYQREVDVWSVAGMAVGAGAVVAAARTAAGGVGALAGMRAVGAMGVVALGSLEGTLGLLGWRGVRGWIWKEEGDKVV